MRVRGGEAIPLNGNNVRWGAIEWSFTLPSVSYTGSGSGTGSYGASAKMTTFSAPSASGVDPGLLVQAATSFDEGTGTGQWTVDYYGFGAPPFGFHFGGGVYRPGMVVTLTATNVEMWSRLGGALQKIKWGALTLRIDGFVVLNLGACDQDSEGAGPNYVPYIGMPMKLEGGVSQGRNVTTPSYDACHPEAGLPLEWSSKATGSVIGGWRYRETVGGGWIDLPITLPEGAFNLTAARTYGAQIDCESFSAGRYSYAGRDLATGSVKLTCVQGDGEDPNAPRTVTTIACSPYTSDPCGSGASVPAFSDVYKSESQSSSKGGNVQLHPDLETAIARMAEGYRCQGLRLTIPETRALVTSSTTDGPTTTSTSSNPVVHPGEAIFRESMGPVAADLEDYLARPCYAPCSSSSSSSSSTSYTIIPHNPATCPAVGSCPPGWTATREVTITYPQHPGTSQSQGNGYLFPASVGLPPTSSGGPPPGADYLWHADPIARYLAYRGAKLWHALRFVPKNVEGEDELLPQEEWKLDDAPVLNQYWKSTRTHWAGDDYLPSAARTKRRSDLISACNDESGHTPFVDAFVGENLRWFDNSRWVTMDCSPTGAGPYEACPPSLELRPDSAPAWSVTGATPSFGSAGITLNPDEGATQIVLELALAQHACPPAFYPATCGKVRLAWSGPRIAEVSAALVSALGGTKPLAELVSGADAVLPRGADSGYAGSWAIQNGNDFTDDFGLDVAPGGESSATMSDPARIHSFGGVAMGQGGRLRITIALADGSGSPVLRYPIFHRAAGKPTVVHESGQCSAILWPDGPGLRFGDWVHFDPIQGWLDPPGVLGLGYKATIVDAIAWRRLVLQGVSALSGGTTGLTSSPQIVPALTTELAQRFDAFEGRSIAQVDQKGIGFPLPMGSGDHLRFALVNTMAETPPYPLFPVRRRDPETWQPTGTPACVVYDLCKEPRDVIATGAPLTVRKPDGTVVSEVAPAPAGWSIQRYSPALDNDESGWKVGRGGTVYGDLAPWHGYLFVGGLAEKIRKWVSLSVSRAFAHVLASSAGDGTFALARADNLTPTDFSHEYPATSLQADSLRIAHQRGGRGDPVWIAYVEGGVARLARCALGGEPGDVIVLGSASQAALCWSGNNVLHAYRLDGGAVYVRRFDLEAGETGSESPTGITGLDDAPIDCAASVGERTLVVTLAALKDGQAVVYRSEGGLTFS